MRVALIAAALAIAACQPRPRIERYEILVSASTDTGDSIAGAEVTINGKRVGETGPAGAVSFVVDAPPGKVLRIATACPDEYRSPERETVLRLRRLASLDTADGDPLHVAALCRPRARHVAVVVRAPGGGGLPVRLLGREIARTDAAGSAHALLSMEPGAEFQLTLVTDDNPYLLPHNPTATFTVGDADQVYVFDQVLEERRPKRKVRRKPPKQGPIKMHSLHRKPWQK